MSQPNEPDYYAAWNAFLQATAFWAPEWVKSLDHFAKVFDAMQDAAFPDVAEGGKSRTARRGPSRDTDAGTARPASHPLPRSAPLGSPRSDIEDTNG